MNDLCNTLNNAGIRFHIYNFCTNRVFYADDLCVIAPSPYGLQALLNIILCFRFGFENVIYNCMKSTCMVVKSHGLHLKYPNVFMDNSKVENI